MLDCEGANQPSKPTAGWLGTPLQWRIVVVWPVPNQHSMRLPFQRTTLQRSLRRPRPATVPRLENSSISALYRASRVGGDFYDFLLTDRRRLVFLLLDVAGKRDEALDVAAAVQERMRP